MMFGEIKVLILMPLALQLGGAETLLHQLLQHGRGRGIRWIVFYFENGPLLEKTRELGIQAEVLSTGRLRNGWSFAWAILELVRRARHLQVDVVFSWMPKAHLYGSVGAKLLGVPSIWFQHGIPGSRVDKLLGKLPAAAILTPSSAVARHQKALSPRRQTRVTYPGIDLASFAPEFLPPLVSQRRKLNLPADGFVIGSVGRLHREKGMDILVRAMPQVMQVVPNAYCVILGGQDRVDTSYAGYLQELISAIGLTERIRLVGHQENVNEWLHACDTFALASRSEGFGIALLEAMALGKPVVATDVGGPAELIKHRENGVLIAPDKESDLAAAISEFARTPEFALRIGAEARQTASAFSIGRYVTSVVESVRAATER